MTPEQLAALVADKEVGTPGPWAWDENHPLNACANVTAEAGAGWTIDIATLYGNSDVVQAPTAPDEPWGDHPIRRADARRIARVPDLEDVVIALVAERDALQAEVARLSTPPDDAEVAELVRDLLLWDGDGETVDNAARQLTRLSHALAAETAKREAMEAVLRDHSLIGTLLLSMQSPVLPPDLRDRLDTVRAEARATIAKHGSK